MGRLRRASIPANPGLLIVLSSGGHHSPGAPAALRVEWESPAGVDLAWDPVTGDSSLSNRTLTLSYGSEGTQPVTDTVLNWRNVDPCPA
jgi:hypothetical protein